MKIRVSIVGQDALMRSFKAWQLTKRVGVIAVVNRAAIRVQADAKRRCPVDTGRLRSSIRINFFKGGLAAEVGTDVEYAAFVEFGTGRQGAASGVTPPEGYVYGPSGGGRARPFLIPAMEKERARFLTELAVVLK